MELEPPCVITRQTKRTRHNGASERARRREESVASSSASASASRAERRGAGSLLLRPLHQFRFTQIQFRVHILWPRPASVLSLVEEKQPPPPPLHAFSGGRGDQKEQGRGFSFPFPTRPRPAPDPRTPSHRHATRPLGLARRSLRARRCTLNGSARIILQARGRKALALPKSAPPFPTRYTHAQAPPRPAIR